MKDWSNEDEIADYLTKLLHKEAFDHAGLIYGMGHAVYSLSDPRAVIFRSFVEKLSEEKGYEKNSNSMQRSSGLPLRSLQKNVRSTRVSVQTLTFTAASPTAC